MVDIDFDEEVIFSCFVGDGDVFWLDLVIMCGDIGCWSVMGMVLGVVFELVSYDVIINMLMVNGWI